MLLRLKAMGPHSALNLNPVSTTDSKPASRSISERSLEPVRDLKAPARENFAAPTICWRAPGTSSRSLTMASFWAPTSFEPSLPRTAGSRSARETLLRVVAPKSGERRLSAIRIDPSKAPSEIDLTTQFDEVLKGIYRFNGDELVVCLAKRDGDDRPTAFDAPTGSNDMLFRLKMAATATATATTPQPATVAGPGDPLPSL